MDSEKQTTEYKSIQKIKTGDKGFKDLAVTCVAFANAQGGKIYIGYDDKKKKPLSGQTLSLLQVNDAITKLRSLCFNVALTSSEILNSETDSQYFIIYVYPSTKSIATTSDGKIYLRVADKCEPVRSEDIQRLSEEKGTYQWEIVHSRFKFENSTLENLKLLANEIRRSPRVKDHVKQLDDIEIAENYHLIDNGFLTNLGVLWLGSAKQRSTISYPITVQYIVYDSLERKVRKEEWHDNRLNPKELLLEIEKQAIELTYSYEFPSGLFRKQIRHYHPKLIRELLVNAFAHKSFTISSDIMIRVFPDRLEISNPGGLPLGITKDNILHAKHRRNPNLIEIMSVLELMEGEGSGYDLIYELNAMEAKNQPFIESSYNEVTVSQSAEIIDIESLPLLDFVLENYQLTQKGYIAFGIIVREKKISSTQLSSYLQLTEEDRLRSYTERLLKDGIICKSGIKKGTQFYVNPTLIRNAKVNIKTSLKTLEPHALKALIVEDIKKYSQSKISDIAARLPDTEIKEIRKIIYSMVANNELNTEGAKTNRRYSLPKW
ncbi:ATP-binding protein [Massilibacteroides sp.]|uniref:ATP-binding protein n=1 Tax=Massilibacteroides sp. TaxID=2034766 RepID=UPI00262BA0E5|nr:ATP-binding protein [Massilibacteroides sp.]MDD4515734.1 ATP-binding protein [Massilibacteroides sp.]